MAEAGGDPLQMKEAEAPGSGPPSPRTLLLLGGGGMKGISHIGAVRALEEVAIRPDAIIGTSIGALIGTLIAGGLGWRELAEIARKMKKEDVVSINRRALWFGGVRAMSVFDGDHFKEWVNRILPAHHFAELIVPLRMNASSLVSGNEVWFGDGYREDVDLLEAIYASCALPVYFPPTRIDDDVLVDGGILNILPLSEASGWKPNRLIVVDVGADLVPPAEGFFDQGLIAVHDRAQGLSTIRQRQETLERYRDLPMMYIRPKIGHLHTFDFDNTQFFIEEGYRAACEALAAAGIVGPKIQVTVNS